MTLLRVFEIYELKCTVIEMQNSSVACSQMCENVSTTRVGRSTSCSKCTVRRYNQCTRMPNKCCFVCCAVLCSAVLCLAVLCCAVLCYMLSCAILCCALLSCAYCSVLGCAVLCYAALCCSVRFVVSHLRVEILVYRQHQMC